MSQQTIDYKVVLADLETQLEQKRAQVTTLQPQIVALEIAIDKLKLGLNLASDVPVAVDQASHLAVPSATSQTVTPPDISPRAFRHMELGKAIRKYLEIVNCHRSTG